MTSFFAAGDRQIFCFGRMMFCWLTLTLALASFASQAAAQQLTRTPVEVRIAHPPASIPALGRQHLVYELHLTNFGSDSLTLAHLFVHDADHPETLIAASDAQDVAPRFRVAGPPLAKQSEVTLPPGRQGIIYQWITLDPQEAPRALLHTFVFQPEGQSPDTLQTEPVPVDDDPLPVMNAPVDAGRWVAVRAPSNGSGHRRSLVVLGGTAHVSERFAIDWVRLGKDGRFYAGDPHDNKNWFSYDQPVRAAAPGRVVLVRDGLPEHPALAEDISHLSFTPKTVTGNVVVIDIGQGHFAVYAHLRPGSISVSEGMDVQAGQEIGRIGNSGHSLAPHLHFHIEDQPKPLSGEGQPFALSTFELIGRLDFMPRALQGVPWTPHPARPARTVTEEVPLENMVLEVH